MLPSPWAADVFYALIKPEKGMIWRAIKNHWTDL
jgi:hypothetical protein